jgi:uncharacterized repeat protein (TIGR01451 family)
MFKKLLSNLPFNPSLIHQVSFYAKRVHREESIRRVGLIFVVLAMVVQFMAVVSPTQASLDQSNNDIIPGGFTAKDQAYQHCVQNNYDFATIIKSYGIVCDNINAASTQSLRSTDYNNQLYSLGRLPYNKLGEVPYRVEGIAGDFYMRPLSSWDSAGASTYTALAGHNIFSVPFFILFNCGNLVIIGKPAPPPSTAVTPKPEIVNKTTIPGMPAAGSQVKPGDLIGYRVFFRNSGNAAATNVFVEDSTPRQTSFISQGSGGADRYAYTDSVYPGHTQEPHVYWAYYNFPAGATGYYVDFTVKVNTGVNNGEEICNIAFIRSNETPQIPSPNKVCHIVKLDTPTQTITPPSTPPPVTITPIIPTAPKPCEKAQNENDTTACLVLSKSVKNISKELVNADGTTVAAGDVIEYTLSASNTGTATVKDFVVQESIGDLLDYATVTEFHGGTQDRNNLVSWPKTDIKAGGTIQKYLTIKIKNPIPLTNTPSSNPGSFDCLITNVYNNAVNIKMPCAIVKTTEQVTTKSLPNTGPGESLAVAFGFIVFISYFFARTRLFAKELDIVKVDYANVGGQ